MLEVSMEMENIVIRRAEPQDSGELAAMCHSLWPDSSAAEHRLALAPLLAGKPAGNLPAIVLLAQEPEGDILGFIEVGLRSHADGCDPSRAVGFIEGWYVAPEHRRKKVGALLLAAAEQWARNAGCQEMASDTWLNNFASHHVHEALGFEVVDRCVHYRKRL